MTRELLILRHGKSDWNQDVDDFHRPLKDRGKRGAQRMGQWLLQQQCLPDFIISSPATRAITTAEKCAKVLGFRAKEVKTDKHIYMAAPKQLLNVLASCPKEKKRIMLVGHNPGLEELLVYLAKDEIEIPADGKLLPTATLARLEMPNDWQSLPQGSAHLKQIIRPGELPEKFSHPVPGGEELRDRPPYYYTQSSVIPYRIENGRLLILVIRSSKNKHWVVPKGIAEPGLSHQASAAKEALEEAGVKGNVTEASQGHYEYEKWGATCSVNVYAMEVTSQLPEHEWEERHRARQWVDADQACTLLKQKALVPMIQALQKQFAANN